jgi:hypothetical protein
MNRREAAVMPSRKPLRGRSRDDLPEADSSPEYLRVARYRGVDRDSIIPSRPVGAGLLLGEGLTDCAEVKRGLPNSGELQECCHSANFASYASDGFTCCELG